MQEGGKKKVFLVKSRFVYSENSVDPFLFFSPLGRNSWHHHLKKFFFCSSATVHSFCILSPPLQPHVKAKVEFSNLACSGTNWPGWGREQTSQDVSCKPALWFLCLLIRHLLNVCFVPALCFVHISLGTKWKTRHQSLLKATWCFMEWASGICCMMQGAQTQCSVTT